MSEEIKKERRMHLLYKSIIKPAVTDFYGHGGSRQAENKIFVLI